MSNDTFVRPEGTTEPLVCLPFPLTRVDNTPPDERERFPNNTSDKDGNPIAEPDKYPEKIALESNPNLMYEHFILILLTTTSINQPIKIHKLLNRYTFGNTNKTYQ